MEWNSNEVPKNGIYDHAIQVLEQALHFSAMLGNNVEMKESLEVALKDLKSNNKQKDIK